MQFIYVSEKADGFSDPVYHGDPDCGSVELLDENDTLTMKWVGQRRLRMAVPGFTKEFRRCIRCGKN